MLKETVQGMIVIDDIPVNGRQLILRFHINEGFTSVGEDTWHQSAAKRLVGLNAPQY